MATAHDPGAPARAPRTSSVATPATPEHPELRGWLAGLGYGDVTVERLTGDVSPRQYHRLCPPHGASAILATYPAAIHATGERFVRTTELLAAAGVRVPRVLGADLERGWMLVEDLGVRTLGDLRERPWRELAGYFTDALAQAERIAALPAAEVAAMNPPLDRALLERELAQTREVFLVPRGLAGEGALAEGLTALLAELCARLADEPPVPCHRDFMARNLIPIGGPLARLGIPIGEPLAAPLGIPPLAGEPEAPAAGPSAVGVLDHQDLRLGPPAYDLASLLNDTLFPPPEFEEDLLRCAAPSPADRLRYHRAAAQRTLKAVGTYAAFARRGAERHLPLIPGTLARGLFHLARTPEGAPLAPALTRLWRPALGGVEHHLLD